VPKTSDTEGLIGDKEIQLMENKFIVNISRAEICDEKALYNSLTEGRLKGYASDVWYCLPDKNERTKKAKSAHYNFNELKNVILSPHCATHEYNAHERYINDAVTQCLDYIMEVEENVGI
jgi:phosphoglycerate dehydrogenase-like enzyme